MNIKNFQHKGLKRLYQDGDGKGLPAGTVGKLNNMLAFLEAMSDPQELRSLPTWKAHQLTGDRGGTWSLHVTKNWRMTFWVDAKEKLIHDIDFEDYH